MMYSAFTLLLATVATLSSPTEALAPFNVDGFNATMIDGTRFSDAQADAELSPQVAFEKVAKCADVSVYSQASECLLTHYMEQQFDDSTFGNMCFPFVPPEIPSLADIYEKLLVASDYCGESLLNEVLNATADKIEDVFAAETCWAELCDPDVPDYLDETEDPIIVDDPNTPVFWPPHVVFEHVAQCSGVVLSLESPSSSCMFQQYVKEQFGNENFSNFCNLFEPPQIPDLDAIKNNLAAAASHCGVSASGEVLGKAVEEVEKVLSAESCWENLCEPVYFEDPVDPVHTGDWPPRVIFKHVAQCAGTTDLFESPLSSVCLLEYFLDIQFGHEAFANICDPFVPPEIPDVDAVKNNLAAAASYYGASASSKVLDMAVKEVVKVLSAESCWEKLCTPFETTSLNSSSSSESSGESLESVHEFLPELPMTGQSDTLYDQAVCYAERYPDLFLGFCKNNRAMCHCRGLHDHYKDFGKNQHLIWG